MKPLVRQHFDTIVAVWFHSRIDANHNLAVPIELGADRRAADSGPGTIRYAHARQELEALGYSVENAGNIEVPIAETSMRLE